MNKIGAHLLGVILTGTVLAQPVSAAAQTLPGSVRDLVGVRASSGEAALETRGFTFISGGTKDDRKLGYWWNGNAKECIRVTTYDGSFEQLGVASKADCHQKSGNNDAAAAAAIGAAALIGAIALTHKSHDHDNDRHYDDMNSEAQFERGYRDGLYNHSYHNYDRSNSYSSGYQNGIRARGYHSEYRGGSYYSGGYSSHVSLRDLEGRDRSYVTGQLLGRGFVVRDSKKTDEGRYATYWNGSSRQCIIVHSRSGTVYSIDHTSDRTCVY
jgi:hypothetical protein